MIKVKMKTYIKKVFNTINTFAIQRIYVKQVFLSLSRDYIIIKSLTFYPEITYIIINTSFTLYPEIIL